VEYAWNIPGILYHREEKRIEYFNFVYKLLDTMKYHAFHHVKSYIAWTN